MINNPKVSFLRIHRTTLLVSVLLIASIAVSIYFGSFKPEATRASILSSPFEFSISIDKDSFQQGEHVPINLTLRNISNKTIVVTWSSFFKSEGKFLPFDVLLTDSNDAYRYQVSEVQARAGAMVSIMLEPYTILIATFVWRQYWDNLETLTPAQKGTYLVKGLTRGMEVTMEGARQTMRLQTPAISFTIK